MTSIERLKELVVEWSKLYGTEHRCVSGVSAIIPELEREMRRTTNHVHSFPLRVEACEICGKTRWQIESAASQPSPPSGIQTEPPKERFTGPCWSLSYIDGAISGGRSLQRDLDLAAAYKDLEEKFNRMLESMKEK